MTIMALLTVAGIVFCVVALLLLDCQRRAEVLAIRKLALAKRYRMRPGWEGRNAPRPRWRRRMIRFLESRTSSKFWKG